LKEKNENNENEQINADIEKIDHLLEENGKLNQLINNLQ
jgi:hypothetical protein